MVLISSRNKTYGKHGLISNIIKGLSILLVCIIAGVSALPLAAFAADIPVLTSPANSATNVNNTNIVFTWQKLSDNVTYYKFDLASDSSFNLISVTDYIDAPATTYTVTKTLAFGTKYYWRVIAVYPGDQTSDPSATWNFTVRSEDTPAATTTTPAATTAPSDTTAATSTPSGSSGGDGIMGFINEIGWPLTLGMVGIFVIFIILLSILLTKPKRTPAGMSQEMAGGMSGGMGGRMGPQQQRAQQGPMISCPSCGFMNTPDRKFCANCGNTITMGQPVQPPPFQQQYQGSPYQTESQAPPFRPQQPPQNPPFQGQPYQGQQFQQQFGPGAPSRMQQGSVCYTCGAQNPPGRQFCGNCGAGLVQAQQQRFQTQQFQQQVFCPNCGAPPQPGQTFCGNCGSPIPMGGGQQHVVGTYQTFSCPICGATINRGMNPCPSCGTWLDWGR